jgi:hypothetical protein
VRGQPDSPSGSTDGRRERPDGEHATPVQAGHGSQQEKRGARGRPSEAMMGKREGLAECAEQSAGGRDGSSQETMMKDRSDHNKAEA